jgi:superfamily II DNA or RNA helicase
MTTHELISKLEWSHPIQLNTKNGIRLLKKAPIDSEWWPLYKENQEFHRQTMRDAGISISKYSGEWTLTWWSDSDLKFKHVAFENIDTDNEPAEEIVLPPLINDSVLFEYQKTSVALGVRSIQKYNRVLLGHSTGVGKTFCALGIARELGKRVAVICPLAVVTSWYRAAKTMNVEIYEAVGWEFCKTGKSKIGKWSCSEKKKFIYEIPNDVILIFDECHRGKANGTSQNSFLIRDSVVQDVQAIALSATIADDPTKLWALGQFLGLHQGGKDYYRFLSSNGCKKTRFGFQFQGGNHYLKRLHHKIYPERGNRLRHSDLGDQFPDTLIAARAFDMENTRAIASEYDDLCLRVEELRHAENFSANVLAEQTRARQKIELLKSPSVASLAKDYLEEGNSIFIAVSFRETMEFLMKELNTDAVICGGQSKMERQGAIDSFQRDKARVIIGISAACREGISLHDLNGKHPRVSLIFPQPSAYDLRQVLGRVHRAGGVTKSLQYIVYAAGVAIEEDTCNSLDGKLKRMDLLNDGAIDPAISLSVGEIEKA